MMVLVIGIAAPPLIAHDVRSRAFLIYFFRPINRWEYMLGKLATVAFFVAMITTAPALLLYMAGVLLSPNLSIVAATGDLPLRILAASAVLIVPTTSMALMFSCLTRESRYAGFAWFTVWILGMVAYSVVMGFRISNQPPNSDTFAEAGWISMLSPYHTLGIVQAWAFDLSSPTDPVPSAIALLTAVTIISLAVLYHRISAPLRA